MAVYTFILRGAVAQGHHASIKCKRKVLFILSMSCFVWNRNPQTILLVASLLPLCQYFRWWNCGDVKPIRGPGVDSCKIAFNNCGQIFDRFFYLGSWAPGNGKFL